MRRPRMRPESFFGKSDSWARLDRVLEARAELQIRRTDLEGFLPCPGPDSTSAH